MQSDSLAGYSASFFLVNCKIYCVAPAHRCQAKNLLVPPGGLSMRCSQYQHAHMTKFEVVEDRPSSVLKSFTCKELLPFGSRCMIDSVMHALKMNCMTPKHIDCRPVERMLHHQILCVMRYVLVHQLSAHLLDTVITINQHYRRNTRVELTHTKEDAVQGGVEAAQLTQHCGCMHRKSG